MCHCFNKPPFQPFLQLPSLWFINFFSNFQLNSPFTTVFFSFFPFFFILMLNSHHFDNNSALDVLILGDFKTNFISLHAQFSEQIQTLLLTTWVANTHQFCECPRSRMHAKMTPKDKENLSQVMIPKPLADISSKIKSLVLSWWSIILLLLVLRLRVEFTVLILDKGYCKWHQTWKIREKRIKYNIVHIKKRRRICNMKDGCNERSKKLITLWNFNTENHTENLNSTENPWKSMKLHWNFNTKEIYTETTLKITLKICLCYSSIDFFTLLITLKNC